MRDFHVHTTFSDGKATPEEMIERALTLKMEAIGFSDHSHSPQPGGDRWSMPLSSLPDYQKEIARLKEKYNGRIEVFSGIEQDLYSDSPTEGFDYLIGAMHFIKLPGEAERYVPVDHSPETLKKAADEAYGGDIYALCEAYYDQLSLLPERMPDCSMIAHFDLITLFLEKTPLFDISEQRYIAAWQRAVDRLLKMNIPFEINTGAVSRGYRTTPYPAADIRAYIKAKGGRFILASDSHRPDMLCSGFDTWQKEAEN